MSICYEAYLVIWLDICTKVYCLYKISMIYIYIYIEERKWVSVGQRLNIRMFNGEYCPQYPSDDRASKYAWNTESEAVVNIVIILII